MSGEVLFGSWLKKWRKEKGIASDLLAERMGCSLVALYKIEAGERRPSRQVALLLAQYLGLPDDEHESFVTFARTGQLNGSAPPAVASVGLTLLAASTVPAVLAGSSASTPWRTARKYKTNLPHRLTDLIGRGKEVEEVRNLLMLTRVRLLTLTGPPGIGKTRLAIEVAAQMLDNFDDGVFLVELAAIDDPDLFLTDVARSLGLKESSEQSIEETLFGYSQERRILLVLDNFEHLLDAAPALAKLMESSPWLKVLATSREALHLRGERRYVVPPLALPNMKGPLTLDVLRAQPSIALFVERAEEAEPNFELSQDNAADVAAVVSRLEGLPLAIELAAARAAQLSPQQMRSSMKSRLTLGRSGARDLPPRQRTLLASIEWSYNLLNAGEQKVFRSLGVFAGGFTLSAVEALHPTGDDVPEDQAVDVTEALFSLAGKNLIRLQKRGKPENPDEEDCYAVLEAIREYALHMLEGSEDEETSTRLRYGRYFLALAELASTNQTGPRQLPLLVRMDEDYSNLIAAYSWLLSKGQNDPELAEQAVFMASHLFYYWDWRGYFTEGREWMASALGLGDRLLWNRSVESEAGEPVEPRLLRLQGRLLNGAGLLAWNQGDLSEATRFFNEGLQVQTEIGNKQGIGATLNNIAILEAEQGRYEKAIEIYHRVLEIDRERGEKRIALTFNNLGVAYWDSGDVEKARSMYRESLALYREMDDPGNMVLALDNLGIVAEHDGEYEAARRYQEEAVNICRTLGYNNSLAHVLANMGSRAVAEGNFAEARGYYGEVLPLSQQQSYHQVIISCLEGIARLCLKQDRFPEAARLWGAADRMREAGKHPVAANGMAKYRENVVATEAGAGQDAFQVAWKEGRGMSVQEAVGFALAQLA